jgi:hypothetical protein
MPSDSVDSIVYPTFDGSVWRSRLEDVTWTALGGTSDPDWIHERVSPPPDNPWSQGHTDERIAYFTKGGGHWGSKCHSHSHMGYPETVSFTFEHFPENGPDSTSETPNLIFGDVNSVLWEVTIDPMITTSTMVIKLNVRRIS